MILWSEPSYGTDYKYIVNYFESGEISETEIENILDEYRGNPLDIRKCTVEEVEGLPISFDLKYKLLLSLDSLRTVSTWRDIRRVAGLSKEELQFIKNFFFLEREAKQRINILKQTFFKLSEKSDWCIARNKLKLNISGNLLDISFTGEYDEGERHLFDCKNISVLFRKFLANRFSCSMGTFRVRWGYGLLYNSSLYSMLMQARAGNLRIRDPKLAPYSGVDENNFLRGLGLSGSFGICNLLFFVSNSFIDSRAEGDTVIKFLNSGYHVSEGQLAFRKNLREKVIGTGVSIKRDRVSAGCMVSSASYSRYLKYMDYSRQIKALSFYCATTGEFVDFGCEILVINGKFNFTGNLVFAIEDVSLGIGYRRLNGSYFYRLGSTRKYFRGYNSDEEGVLYILERKFRKLRVKLLTDFHRRLSRQSADDLKWGRVFYTRIYGIGRGNFVLDLIDDYIPEEGSLRRAYFKYSFVLDERITVENALRLKLERGRCFSFAISTCFRYTERWWYIKFGASEFQIGDGGSITIFEPSVPYHFDFANLYGNGYRFFIVLGGRLSENLEIAFAYKPGLSYSGDFRGRRLERLIVHLHYNQ